MREKHTVKILMVAVPLIIAFFSVFVVSGIASSAEFHAGSIAALDEKQTTVLELTAASTAASAAVTLLPGDTATPIAEKLADLSSGFLVVLCAIYLEKYLLTLTGFAAFSFLIPISCLLYAANVFLNRDGVRTVAKKLLIFGIAIVLVIPVSVRVSNLIEDTYQASIEATIESAKQTTDEVEDSTEELTGETEQGFLERLISKITDGISSVASGISEKVGDMINSFIEALAVMLVTSCVIPILVILFFVWLVKVTFSISLPVSYSGAVKGVRGAFRREDGEDGQP